jgi:hypothetical protein
MMTYHRFHRRRRAEAARKTKESKVVICSKSHVPEVCVQQLPGGEGVNKGMLVRTQSLTVVRGDVPAAQRVRAGARSHSPIGQDTARPAFGSPMREIRAYLVGTPCMFDSREPNPALGDGGRGVVVCAR